MTVHCSAACTLRQYKSSVMLLLYCRDRLKVYSEYATKACIRQSSEVRTCHINLKKRGCLTFNVCLVHTDLPIRQPELIQPSIRRISHSAMTSPVHVTATRRQ